MTNELSGRQLEILRAVLSYAFSNLDAVNEAFEPDVDFGEREIVQLVEALDLTPID